MHDLKQRIQADMIAAMRAKEKQRLSTIRLLLAAIKQCEIDAQTTLDNRGVTVVVEKMVKQRRESIKQYRSGQRPELAAQEQQQIDVLQVYLPKQLSETEITTAINDALASTGAASMKDMGKVMAILKPTLQGKVDMSVVSAKVKQRLIS